MLAVVNTEGVNKGFQDIVMWNNECVGTLMIAYHSNVILCEINLTCLKLQAYRSLNTLK